MACKTSCKLCKNLVITQSATIERKLDGVNNGICDSTFALNNTITNGFFGVQNALCQGFNGINQSISTEFRGLDNRICDLGYALKDCCCQTQRAGESLWDRPFHLP